MLAQQVVKLGEVSIVGQTLRARLIKLDMCDFDVILGMDWLANNGPPLTMPRKKFVLCCI